MSAPDSRPAIAGGEPPVLNVRETMWRIMVAGMFGSVWAFTTSGVALTRYAQFLGLPLFWYGVLGSMPLIGAIAALPTSYFIARYGRRKRVFLIAGMGYRALWVPIALIPWVLPNAWWWPSLMALQALTSLGAYVMSPAMLSWFADVVPKRIRGRFFSRSRRAGQVAGLLATFLVTECLDSAESTGRMAMLRTISVTFALSAMLGVIELLWLLPSPDVEHRPDAKITLLGLLKQPLGDKDFRFYLAFNVTQVLSAGCLGQYIYLYLSQVLGLSSRITNAMALIVPCLVSLLAMRVWGDMVDRFGCKPVLVVGAICSLPGAAAWLLVTPESPLVGYVVVLISVAAWSGVGTASFSLMLRMSASRAGRRQGTAFLAVNSVTMAVAGALSGVLGGSIAAYLGSSWHASLFGLPLTYHSVLFLISSSLRILALPWLFFLHEPGAHPPRAALKYVLASASAGVRRILRAPLSALRRGADDSDKPSEE